MDSSGRGMPRVSLDDVYLAPVHLNVGGTTYTTTLDTLTRYPDSKIAKLFNGTLSVPVDSINNHYFLDVNGSVFAHILDFLRYKELILPEGFNQLQLLKKQAEYFEIEDMVKKLEYLINDYHENQGGNELSEEDHDKIQQIRHKPRSRKKKSNTISSHTLEEERVDGGILGEVGEKNSVAVKETVDVAKTIDHTSLLRQGDTNIVIVNSSNNGEINIYSSAKVKLEELIQDKRPKPVSTEFGTYLFCNINPNNTVLPYTLHIVNQLQSKGYHLAFFNFTNSSTYYAAKREFVLFQKSL